jgi:hypothetical protein
MRSILLLTLVATSLTARTASADDRLHLTPPLYREQAHAVRQTRHAAELTTTPQPVAAAPLSTQSGRIVTEVVASAR